MRTTKFVPLLLLPVIISAAQGVRAQGLPPDGLLSQASWSFSATSNWESDQASLPLRATNLSASALGNGTAVVLDSTNGTASGLCYAVFDGTQTNASTDAGSLSMWVGAVSWASTNLPGGEGVGQVVPIFEAGGCISGTSGGGFGLFLDESGCWLSLKARSIAGAETTCFTVPISFATNTWRCIAVVYSQTNSGLFLDGLSVVTNGLGVTGIQDWAVAATNGLWFGSGPDGVQSRCMMDDVFTFDCALSSSDAQWLYATYYPAYFLNPENPANVSTLTSAPFYTSTNLAGGFVAMAGTGNLTCVGATDPAWAANDSVWMTNVTAQAGSAASTVLSFTVAGGTTNDGAMYDVLATSRLSSPLTNSQFVWLGQVAAAHRYSVGIGSGVAFVLLGTPYDQDQDGIPSAMESLLFHLDPVNGDQNANGIPDGWEVAYFGSLQASSGDFDGDGVADYTEWSWGLDPNKVRFSLSVSNQIVSSRLVPLQVAIAGGIPSKMALVVDSTNFASATWTAYSSNIVADVGLSEGWHDIWVGLHGRPENSYQSWRYLRVKLDQTQPLLVITNPASENVSAGLVQVQGYASEAVASISYDLSNTNGTLTGQLAVIIGQDYSTNTAEFTTNYFQCYDVLLAGGTNTITIHATDWAGNMASISTNIVYSPSTNAPVARLLWPQDGMRISGGSITLNGQVDDPTSTVTVSVTDTNGSSATYGGRVGRDGLFWIENVPLNPSTNFVALSLSEAAGVNTITTNFTLCQSEVSLTVATVQPGDTSVSGYIDTAGYTIWVNGTNATPVDGYWTAPIRPVGRNGGLLQVRAIPNSDNGGNGSGGGGTSNPNSTNSIDAEATVQPAQGVFIAAYHEFDQQVEDWEGVCEVSRHRIDWEEGRPASGEWLWYDSMWATLNLYSWPASEWPEALPAGTWTEIAAGYTNVHSLPPPGLSQEHCDTYQDLGGGSTERRTADTELRLFTGGSLGSTGKRLWVISGSATDADTGQPIPPEHIYIGSFGHLDADGNLLVDLPDGDPVVTAKVKWNKKYVGNLNAVAYQFGITANSDTLSEKYVWRDFCVGQAVYLDVVGLDDDIHDRVAEWTLPGKFVNRQPDPATCPAYFDLDTNLLVRSSVTNQATSTYACFVDELLPGTVSVNFRYRYGKPSQNGQWRTNTLSGKFNVHKPTTTFIPPASLHGPPTVMITSSGSLSLGLIGYLDMSFGHQITSANFSGTAGYTQVVGEGGDEIRTYQNSLVLIEPVNQLDNQEFPRGQPAVPANTNTPVVFWDRPAVSLASNQTDTFEKLHFDTYLFFRPDGGPGPNIFVPLRKVEWSLEDTATHSTGVWTATGSADGPSDTDWSDFPHWNGTISNSQFLW